MFEKYLEYHHIPCGAVINRIMSKENLTQRELASRSGITYQRINDFISNKRRISVDISLKLEKALNIETQGFFYFIQTNHDVYMTLKNESELSHPDLSKFREALFWDTKFDDIDWKNNCHYIIRRVFEYGNETEIKETIRFYGNNMIVNELKSIEDIWNKEIRKNNIEKYLNDEHDE